MSVEFTIRGRAHPQGRPRFARNGRTYTATADKEWHERVVSEWRRCSGRRILDGPYEVVIKIHEPRPKSHKTVAGELSHAGRKAPIPTRGDLDNYAKGVLDALVRQEVIPDDRYLVELRVSKQWATTTDEGHTDVRISRNTPG
jgi:Holliday junction resolvase RusA-like endonuclease